jgi:hypothetical protein
MYLLTSCVHKGRLTYIDAQRCHGGMWTPYGEPTPGWSKDMHPSCIMAPWFMVYQNTDPKILKIKSNVVLFVLKTICTTS